ncbi:MAG: hypothetical protein ABR543_18460 [Gemmatimonadaceae bacterium]
MRRITLAAMLVAASSLAACKKTGEGEYQVKTPDVDVSTDTTTIRTPDVDVTTDTVRLKVPKVEVKNPPQE